jgi:hypothetical protein
MLPVMESRRQNGGKQENTSGWVDTETAAAALEVSARTIRNMIRRGELEAKEEHEGLVERYLVSVDSVYSLRDKRKSEGKFRRDSARKQLEGNTTELLREAIGRLEIRAAEVAELKTRLELTEQTDTSIREQLERERERAMQEHKERLEAQEEARKLRDELEQARRPWYRRLFG